jgi:hypothetical protein
MTAVVFHESGDVRLDAVAEPNALTPPDALISPSASASDDNCEGCCARCEKANGNQAGSALDASSLTPPHGQ